MKFIVRRSKLSGSVQAPPSKSHTIRAVAIAALAHGKSKIIRPLDSLDTRAALSAYRAFGAKIETTENSWLVSGTSGSPSPPTGPIDTQNSGTTFRIAMGTAAMIPSARVELTGDSQVCRRPVGPLLRSLRDLGAEARSTRDNDLPPVVIRGKIRGGSTSIRATTSQYLTSLLLHCPLADGDSTIEVPLLNERPYVEMTLDWLRRQDIKISHDDHLRHFSIPGGQNYRAFETTIPGDFSSATFFLVAAAITGSRVTFEGLDTNDTQGDKAVVTMLERMGAEVSHSDHAITLQGKPLRGGSFDLNATPDALPAMAVAACAAEGETRLLNVPQARQKETDRLSVMNRELTRMGARIEELPDGLIIRGGPLQGTKLHGHGDHRVVMALATAGLISKGTTEIDTAESVSITFPTFLDTMRGLGADIENAE